MRLLLTTLAGLAFISCGRFERSEDQASGTEKSLNVKSESREPEPSNPQNGSQGQPPTGSPTAGQDTSQSPSDDPAKQLPTKPILTRQQAIGFELPMRDPTRAQENLWATYYYTPRLFHVDNGYELLQLNGEPLGPRLSKLGWCQSAMEGSVQIFYQNAWRTYNYAGVAGKTQVDCSEYYDHPVGRTRYKVARGAFGDGVRQYILQPFRTIAVDPDVISYGSIIYIPEARGLEFTLPSGQKRTHDGYFFAGDTGGLIHGNHIDVFLGIATRTPFPWITSRSSSKVPYEIVADQDIIDALTSLHLLNE